MNFIMPPAWVKKAECSKLDPETIDAIFFPNETELTSAMRKARPICDRCPVRPECLSYYLDEDEGIYAATSPRQRKAFRAQIDEKQPPTTHEQCGTQEGAKRHRKLGEKYCEACTAGAKARYEDGLAKRRTSTEKNRQRDAATIRAALVEHGSPDAAARALGRSPVSIYQKALKNEWHDIASAYRSAAATDRLARRERARGEGRK